MSDSVNSRDNALPPKWHVEHLKEYCDVVTSSLSYTDFKELEEESSNDAVTVLGIKVSDMNLTGNETQIVISNLTKRISLIRASKKTVPPGTIVFPKRGAAIATNKKRLTATWTVFDPNLIGVRPKKDLISEFVYYWFLHFDLRKITDPGPTPQLNKKDLEPLLIPIPPIDEQRRVAQVLTTVQTAIAQQKRMIALTRELKSALMKKLFSEGLNGEKQKESEIGLVPESWKIQPFETFTTLQRGKDLTKREFNNGSVPVAGSNGVIGYHDIAFVKAPGITVGRSGSAGKVTFYKQDFWAHNTSLYVKDFHGNDPRFAAYYLEMLDLAKYKTGASVPTLDRNSFKYIPVTVPPKDEQVEIATILSTLDKKIDILNLKKEKLEELFRTLLHQLMTGQVRVKDLELPKSDC